MIGSAAGRARRTARGATPQPPDCLPVERCSPTDYRGGLCFAASRPSCLRARWRLNACKYTQKQLQTLKGLIPNDLAAYDAGFSPAVDDALARRAEGACNKKKAQSSGAGTGSTAAPAGGGTTPPPPASSAATGKGAAASAATSAPATVQPPPTPTPQPQPAAAIAASNPISVAATATDPATDAPFPVLALAILAGLFALAGLVVALVRWRGWEPAWTVELRHAAGEAGWRASSTWAEFTDFVRFGR
jgi:hypothetical protein